MMRVALLIGAALLLAGCRDQLQDAKDRYDFLASHGASDADKCAQAQKVADAAADQKRGDDYSFWRIRANLDCNAVQLESLR